MDAFAGHGSQRGALWLEKARIGVSSRLRPVRTSVCVSAADTAWNVSCDEKKISNAMDRNGADDDDDDDESLVMSSNNIIVLSEDRAMKSIGA